MATGDDITGPINLGHPTDITIRELAEKIIALTNSKSRLITRPLPSDDPLQRQPDIAEAKSRLNWEPKIQLEEGLCKAIQYFERKL
jgi:UDP-glucuronate decarboxylase